MFRIRDNGNSPQSGYKLMQQFEPLAVEFGGHEGQSRHVATWFGKTLGKACRYGISAENVDHWPFQFEFADDLNGGALRHNEIDGQAFKILSKFGHAFDCVVSVAKIKR